jgi:hypothetical protein
MTVRTPRIVLAAIVIVAGATLGAAPRTRVQNRPDVSTSALAAAAVAYVGEYQRAFSFLVADEKYLQRRLTIGGKDTLEVPTDRRRITGELFMTYLPVDREWIAVRDVMEVDGEPVAGGEDLRKLLQSGDLTGVVQRVANHNARYNIGGVIRNFNEPTLPLLIFDERRVGNFSFDRERVEERPDATLVTLAFEERRRPTIIRNARGNPVYSSGEITLEAGTGRVRRTVFKVQDGSITVRLVTTYRREAKLDLWVPSTFTERYEGDQESGEREIITGEATYSNYRRFEVTGRIKR